MGALVAAGLLMGGLTAGSASAADFGGNCCADLEERIAELEATTARKGNRKVSLTISGWVAEQVMWWDDDFESNVYVTGLGSTLSSHFKMTGQATISPGWYAGYVMHVEVVSSDALLGIDQDTSTSAGILNGENVQLLQSFWFIKSDTLGKVSIGRQSQASDNTAILVDGSGSLVPANYVPFDYGGFYLRDAAGNPTGSIIAGQFVHIDWNGVPLNAVRYDSPTFAGFSVSASWGMDDFWDVAVRYAGEFGAFKVAAAAAYFENTDDTGLPNNSADGTEHFQVGAYIQHIPTGLFAYGAYGDYDNDIQAVDKAETWYVKGGLRERWTPLGHTVLYGEYMDGEQDAGAADAGSVELWGLGVVQEIDAAAMSLWLSYRNIEADTGDLNAVGANTPGSIDFQYVKFGALINF
jgi:predicted porin